MEYRMVVIMALLAVTLARSAHEHSESMSPCPDVSSGCPDLTCDNSVQSYLKVDDRHCPACTVCISDYVPANRNCPSHACPMWMLPEGCGRPRLYNIYFEFRGNECQYCDILVCEKPSLMLLIG